MPSVTVRPVSGKRDLNAFIRLPFRLHRGTPWVPPLIMERKEFLDRDKNPFFDHAEAEYFLAERDGEVGGPDHRARRRALDPVPGRQRRDVRVLRVGERPGDRDGTRGGRDRLAAGAGRERMLGPMDFTTNDECGILIEGYERDPLVLEPWHPPYYRELLEALGMTKSMDLLMWELYLGSLKQGDRFHDFIHEAAAEVGVRARRGRPPDAKARPRGRGHPVHGGLQRGLGSATGASSRSPRRRSAFQAKNLKPILDENWAMIAEREGEVVGAALTLPDINQVLAKMNGRLLPFGWWHFLTGRRKIDRVRVFALGVKPEYQHFGVAAALYVRHVETAARVRQKWRRDGLDPRGQRAHEPGDGGNGRQGRQALPALRAAALRIGLPQSAGRAWSGSAPGR